LTGRDPSVLLLFETGWKLQPLDQLRRSRPASRVTFFTGPKESNQRKGVAVAGLLSRESANQFPYIALLKTSRFVVVSLVIETSRRQPSVESSVAMLHMRCWC